MARFPLPLMLDVQEERVALLEEKVTEVTSMCNLGEMMRLRHEIGKLMHHREIPQEKGEAWLEKLQYSGCGG